MIELNFNKGNGLIPAIVQDNKTNEILMVAFINKDAWEATLLTGKATYFSRTRQKLWVKGETSNNTQFIKEIWIDCDNDTVLFKIDQKGDATCHTGHRSCFYKKIENNVIKIMEKPLFNPDEVYKLNE